MFGSEVLDIALGLVLVFLLVSLVLTAVREAIEAWLRSRAGDLNQAIFELLQRDEDLLKKFYDHPLVFALHRMERGGRDALKALPTAPKPPAAPGAPKPKAETIGAKARRLARSHLPSYIPRETFAAALIDLLRSTDNKGAKVRDAYDALERLSNGQLGRLRGEIEGWYDGAMDRASGWYKRRTQKILFVLGLSCAIVLNVNSVVIARHMATDAQARAFVADYAEGITRNGAPGTDQIQAFQGELETKVGLPIGWSASSLLKLRELVPAVRFAGKGEKVDLGATAAGLLAVITFLVGYLITAFAAMLGAPFWFDVLNRIMVIRSTVKPKEKSPDEPSEDGGKDKRRPDDINGGTGQSANASGPIPKPA